MAKLTEQNRLVEKLSGMRVKTRQSAEKYLPVHLQNRAAFNHSGDLFELIAEVRIRKCRRNFDTTAQGLADFDSRTIDGVCGGNQFGIFIQIYRTVQRIQTRICNRRIVIAEKCQNIAQRCRRRRKRDRLRFFAICKKLRSADGADGRNKPVRICRNRHFIGDSSAPT